MIKTCVGFLVANSLSKVKNINYPNCIDCKHFMRNIFDNNDGKCSIFGVKNVVTGEIKYSYAELVRQNENDCGIEGKYWLSNITEIDKNTNTYTNTNTNINTNKKIERPRISKEF